jgi:DNA-binding MarR family transcriptional regulator
MSAEKRNLDALKLKTSAFKVICYLSFKDGPIKPTEIAKGLKEKPSTVRARLAELKKKGLVEVSSEGYVSTVIPYDILMKLYRDIKKETGEQ